MSFLTCFCDFPQKEHLTSSLDSPNLAITAPRSSGYAGGLGYAGQLAGRDHFVNNAVLLRLSGAHYEVAVCIRRHFIDRLAGVEGDHLVEQVAHTDDLLSLYLDVRRLTGRASVRLV